MMVASFSESAFSDKAKARLEQHFSRLRGTLAFWKREATRNSRFHYYCLWWTIFSASIMPFLTQAISPSDAASKWFLTIIAAHIALLLSSIGGSKSPNASRRSAMVSRNFTTRTVGYSIRLKRSDLMKTSNFRDILRKSRRFAGSYGTLKRTAFQCWMKSG